MKTTRKIGKKYYHMRGGRFDSKAEAQRLARQYRSRYPARVIKGKSLGRVAYWVFVAD